MNIGEPSTRVASIAVRATNCYPVLRNYWAKIGRVESTSSLTGVCLPLRAGIAEVFCLSGFLLVRDWVASLRRVGWFFQCLGWVTGHENF